MSDYKTGWNDAIRACIPIVAANAGWDCEIGSLFVSEMEAQCRCEPGGYMSDCPFALHRRRAASEHAE